MSTKEQRYVHACERIGTGTITKRAAAEQVGVSYRQMQRICRRYEQGGMAALCHESRGRRGTSPYSDELKRRVLTKVRDELYDCSAAHCVELLAQEDNIVLSPPTLRRWMREAGIGYTAPRRKRRRRSYRAPRECFGMMLQGDGSFHRWFGGRGPRCCLIVFIDDATGMIDALCAEEEHVSAVLTLLRRWVHRHGIPQAVYFDRRNAYVARPSETIAEQLAGTLHETTITRTCRELGIEVINAHSPQAKGRVERVNRTLQDRLVPAFRRAGISTIAAANRYLEGFLRRFNARFAHQATDPRDAHVRVGDGVDVERIFSKRVVRVVANDWTIRYENTRYQIGRAHGVHPKMQVEVARWLDGSVHVYCRNGELPIAALDQHDIFDVA